jgi:AraC-like DNA-binding protein/quercetin dioxygenase-like cupin family protein
VKVLPFVIPKPQNSTLVIQQDRAENFYSKLHEHEEIQLSYIVRGEGTFYIGDCFGQFGPGDIFAIGEHLPHVFSIEPSAKDTHMISLFFTPGSYGDGFFEHPEFDSFRPFFDSVKQGFRIRSNTKELGRKIIEMTQQSSLDRFLSFIELLYAISHSELAILSSVIHKKRFSEVEGNRMREIMDYTLENFDQKLSVADVAEIANMTPNAFCRYFKQRANKTYVNFVLDIRIGHACKLLSRSGELRISEIAFKSGFNNLTNFNRKFKQIKGLTPSEFRNSF